MLRNYFSHFSLNYLNLVFFFLIIYINLFFSCFPSLRTNEEEIFQQNQKYYLGRGHTGNFQTICEEILQYYGYYIDSYDNDYLSTQISTKWRVREPYKSETTIGFLDAKTKILIKGETLTDSYTINNGYSYNCFLLYQNVGYKNNGYILINDTPELKKDLEVIITHLREKFDYDNFQ